jgi:uncharacterized membrane-anchored protein
MHLPNALRKVPEITLVFWIVKLLTTAMGESTTDFLILQINPYIAVGLGGVGLAIALALQFSVRQYIPWIYWLAVTMVAVFGTMAADAVHIQLGVPYLASTIFFLVVLAVVFATWYKVEHTLSIHSITSRRREVFYWSAVMATFALGTAAGDMTAFTLHLGFLSSVLLFAATIALVSLAYWLFRLDEIIAFWFAYILTRPLGASVADWIGKSHSISGLGFGDGNISMLLAAFIIIFVGYMTFDRREAKRERAATR